MYVLWVSAHDAVVFFLLVDLLMPSFCSRCFRRWSKIHIFRVPLLAVCILLKQEIAHSRSPRGNSGLCESRNYHMKCMSCHGTQVGSLRMNEKKFYFL